MYRNFIFFLFTTALLLPGRPAAAQKTAAPPAAFSVRLKIKDLPKDKPVLLSWYYGESKQVQDTAQADASGYFSFTKKEKLPRGMYIVELAGLKNKSFDLLLADDQVFDLETDTADLTGHLLVKGCDENKDYYNYLRFVSGIAKKTGALKAKQPDLEKKQDAEALRLLSQQLEALAAEQRAYETKYIRKHPASLLGKLLNLQQPNEAPKETATIEQVLRYNRAHYFDGTDWSEPGLAHNPWFHKKISDYLDKYIPQTPDSLSAACDYLVEKARPNRELFKLTVQYLTYKYDVRKPTCLDAVLFHMVDTYFKTGQVDWFAQSVTDYIIKRIDNMRKHTCGVKAANVFVKDTAGKAQELLQVKAKYTLLAFWDPDCSHCQVEMPELKAEYDELKPYGLEVFAVVPMHDTAPWKKFIREHGFSWQNGMGADEQTQSDFVSWYEVYTTPIFFLLDEQKVIIAKNLGPTGMCNEIRKLEGLPLKAEKPDGTH